MKNPTNIPQPVKQEDKRGFKRLSASLLSATLFTLNHFSTPHHSHVKGVFPHNKSVTKQSLCTTATTKTLIFRPMLLSIDSSMASSYLFVCCITLFFTLCFAADPFARFVLEYSYITVSPLGVPQQVNSSFL